MVTFSKEGEYMPKRERFLALEFTWDGKIRSARELFRLLHDFLTKYKYDHVYHELRDVPGAIEGTATFWDTLIGKKDYSKLNKPLLFIGLGILLIGIIVGVTGITGHNIASIVAGFIMLILGIILMSISYKKMRRCLELRVEGETYRAKAQLRGKTSSEVYDVVSNCRVVFTGKVGTPDKTSYVVSVITNNEKEWASLKDEFESLTIDFDTLKPRIEVPEAVSPPDRE
jgi:hypothetical protein